MVFCIDYRRVFRKTRSVRRAGGDSKQLPEEGPGCSAFPNRIASSGSFSAAQAKHLRFRCAQVAQAAGSTSAPPRCLDGGDVDCRASASFRGVLTVLGQMKFENQHDLH
jgi:hypothetical protein